MNKEKTDHRIVWRRVDTGGHEAARLFQRDLYWHLQGTAIFVNEWDPCELHYEIVCNEKWETLSASIVGWVANREIGIVLTVDQSKVWAENGIVRPEVTECIDLDLNFSPMTNVLPIRRLNLDIGQSGAVRAAWLRFPSFSLEPLDQIYKRLGPTSYRYSSAGGRFTTELIVDDAGFVTDYPNFWKAEATFDLGPLHAE